MPYMSSFLHIWAKFLGFFNYFFKATFIIRLYFTKFFHILCVSGIKILAILIELYNIIDTLSFCRVMGCLVYAASGLQMGFRPNKKDYQERLNVTVEAVVCLFMSLHPYIV